MTSGTLEHPGHGVAIETQESRGHLCAVMESHDSRSHRCAVMERLSRKAGVFAHLVHCRARAIRHDEIEATRSGQNHMRDRFAALEICSRRALATFSECKALSRHLECVL